MKKNLPLLLVVSVASFWTCKDSSTSPPPANNPLVGTWEYSANIGLVDTLDPLSPFFPAFTFDSDLTYEEVARFVQLPSRTYLGYKYVKAGTYLVTSDTLSLEIQREIYLSLADSLQPKPTPVAVSSYRVEYHFTISADTLSLTRLGSSAYFNYFRR